MSHILILPRVVHAKAAGAHGHFEVTHDVSDITSAAFLGAVGTKTPVTARISTVGPERGSADTARDPRGWGIKLFTTEGNQDWVFNNTVSNTTKRRWDNILTFAACIFRSRPYKISFSQSIA